MTQNQKSFYFEYMLFKLGMWYSNLTNKDENDFSVLKSLKLLFFVSSCNSKSNEESLLLDVVFDKFRAMPYGHVESDVYDAIKDDNLTFYKINARKASLKASLILNENNFETKFLEQFETKIDESILTKIDESINYLKERNAQFVSYSAFELVELSHLYSSWDKNYKKGNSHSVPISIDDIKSEMKIFSL